MVEAFRYCVAHMYKAFRLMANYQCSARSAARIVEYNRWAAKQICRKEMRHEKKRYIGLCVSAAVAILGGVACTKASRVSWHLAYSWILG